MSLAKYQREEHSRVTGISLFEPKTPNEKFLWNAWKQAEIKNKVLQQERNSMLKQGCKTEMEASEDVTVCKNNTQSEYIVSNEI